MKEVLAVHGSALGIPTASDALGVPRSTAYRWRRPREQGSSAVRGRPPRTLSAEEQSQALAALRSDRFADKAPAQVYATLLEEGTYICSVRTMYRILWEHREVRERRAQLVHPRYAVPVLVARKPNEVWTWDVTHLKGPVKGEAYPLYVVLDLFSRYVVAWPFRSRPSDSGAKQANLN